MNLPKYDSKNSNHIQLAKFAEQCHETHGEKERDKLIEKISLLSIEIIQNYSTENRSGIKVKC